MNTCPHLTSPLNTSPHLSPLPWLQLSTGILFVGGNVMGIPFIFIVQVCQASLVAVQCIVVLCDAMYVA